MSCLWPSWSWPYFSSPFQVPTSPIVTSVPNYIFSIMYVSPQGSSPFLKFLSDRLASPYDTLSVSLISAQIKSLSMYVWIAWISRRSHQHITPRPFFVAFSKLFIYSGYRSLVACGKCLLVCGLSFPFSIMVSYWTEVLNLNGVTLTVFFSTSWLEPLVSCMRTFPTLRPSRYSCSEFYLLRRFIGFSEIDDHEWSGLFLTQSLLPQIEFCFSACLLFSVVISTSL